MVTPTNGVAPGGKRKPILIQPGAEPRAPRPPRDLGVVGRRWWKQVWRGGRRWLDPASDLLVVELICRTQERVAEIERDLDVNGRYYHTKSGQELPRPGVADVKSLRAQVVAWLALLGFTPSARAEMGQRVETANDELTKFRGRTYSRSVILDSSVRVEPPAQDSTEPSVSQ